MASVSTGGLVTARSNGSVEITASYAQTKGSLTFTVQPAVTYRLSGTIRDAVSGAGLPATVAVKQAGTVTNSATADSSGRYSIAGIASGPVEVTAAAADYVPVTTSLTILSDRTLDFALRPTAPCPSIGFDTLQPHDADFTTYSTCGFTVTATTSNWKISTAYGKPAPFIQFRTPANATAVGEILVTSAGSAFTFRSVDLYSSTTPIPYVITGIANGATVLSIQSTHGNTFGNFATIANPQPATPIDALLIRLSNPATCCGNPMGIDNIQLAY